MRARERKRERVRAEKERKYEGKTIERKWTFVRTSYRRDEKHPSFFPFARK